MKHLHSLLILSFVAVAMSACVEYDSRGGHYRGQGRSYSSVSVGTYGVLPGGYSGDAYRYGNRYYYGGLYQRGSYNYGGRSYSDRYYHGGQYYYGGNHRHYGGGGNQSYSPSYRGGYHGRPIR